MAKIIITTIEAKRNIQGKLPVLIGISQKSERAYIKSGIFIDNAFQLNGDTIKGDKKKTQELRYIYSIYLEKFENIRNKEIFTAKQIKDIIKIRTSSGISLISYWQERVEQLRADKRYNYAQMNEESIRLFRLSEGDILIDSINTTIVEHHKKWLEKRGHTPGGVAIHLSHLRAMVNELIKEGMLKCDVHPFAHTTIPAPDSRECDITLEDFIKIREFRSESKKISLARDMFLLSFYLCGLNFKDLTILSFKNDVLTYSRQKTASRVSNTFTIPILAEAREIINKYITPHGKLDFGYKFTYHNLQCYINGCMKMLKDEIGLEGSFCFYSARKTFAQFASELGIPDGVIDYCLGHSDKKKGILSYYTKVKKKQAQIATERVADYVKNPDKYKDYIEMRANIMMLRG